MATICSSVKRLFLIGSSFLSKSTLSRNYRSEKVGQVTAACTHSVIGAALNDQIAQGIDCEMEATMLYWTRWKILGAATISLIDWWLSRVPQVPHRRRCANTMTKFP
jgi:hypothetical protein